jgi:hypothetical protein
MLQPYWWEVRILRNGLAVIAVALCLVAPELHACGVSGPDGIMTCSLREHQQEQSRLRFRLGLSGIETVTTIRFSGGLRGDEGRSALLGSLTYALSDRAALLVGAGVALGGHLNMPNGTHDFLPGAIAQVGASYSLLGAEPFLIVSSMLSVSAARTEQEVGGAKAGYEASDLRAGAAFGTTIFDAVRPYALGRVFGGPIFWRYAGASVTGTDASHYQLGAGLAVELEKRIDLFAEGVPLGERAVSVGIAIAL